MEIYVMRHGTTVWNEKRITQGRTQNRLSKTGKDEVLKQSENFKDTKIDVIFSSPLMRAMQTANIMNKNLNAEIKKDDRIIEVDQGIFVGQRKDDFTDEERFAKNQRTKDNGMETYEEIYDRVIDFINFLRQNYSDKKILVVTHGLIASYIAKISNKQELQASEIKIKSIFKNAEIKVIEI